MTKQQQKEAQIYREYVNAKEKGATALAVIATAHKISRATLYNIVKRVEQGDRAKIKICNEASRLECLWRHKYETQVLSLGGSVYKLTTPELKYIIKQMKKDGFTEAETRRRLNKARTTIRYHLK